MQQFLETIIKNKYAVIIVSVAAALFSIMLLIWIFIGTANIGTDQSPDLLEAMMVETFKKNVSDYNFWYKINVAISFLSVFASLFASLFAAITTKENVAHFKYITIVLTFIASSALSFTTALRIPENINSFIELNGELTKLHLKYTIEKSSLKNSLEKNNDINQAKDIFPIEILKLNSKFYPDYDLLLKCRMRVWLNIGQQAASKNCPIYGIDTRK